MKPLLILKTIFRTPLKTFFTFILLSLVMFSLITRVAEYSIIEREIKNAAKEYQGIGTVEISEVKESFPHTPSYITTDPRLGEKYIYKSKDFAFHTTRYEPLTRDDIARVLELPYITDNDTRYMTAGISDKYYRLDEGIDYYNYTARHIIEATLSDVEYDVISNGVYLYEMNLTNPKLIAGNPTHFPRDSEIEVLGYSNSPKPGEYTEFVNPVRSVIMFDSDYKYNSEYIKKLPIGDRYVFVLRYDTLSGWFGYYFGDYLANPWAEAVWSVEDNPGDYLDSSEYKDLRELVDITNKDMHTFDVVYTQDMSSIARFAKGDMAIREGRKLTPEDSMNQSNICVISSEFADANDLHLNDKIKLKLGSQLFEQYKGLGAVAATYERDSKSYTDVEVEIIGIYMDADEKSGQMDNPHWSYSINTIFVPKSLFPLNENQLEDHLFSSSEFSFVVGDAWTIPSFMEALQENKAKFENMGIEISFYDDGWADIMEDFLILKKVSLIKILVFLIALFAITGFVVFIFIERKKQEYAVMRALGTTKRDSSKSILMPLLIIGVSAIIVGSVFAWDYTIKTVAQNEAFDYINSGSINPSMPLLPFFACIVGELLLILSFALFSLRRMGRTPTIELLQNGHNKRMNNKLKVDIDSKYPNNNIKKDNINKDKIQPYSIQVNGMQEIKTSSAPISENNINAKKYRGHILSYIFKHIFRSGVKSLLVIIITALIFGAVGYFATMRETYIDLIDNTVIKAKFPSGLYLPSVDKIIDGGYGTDPYYEYTHLEATNYSIADIVVTNDIARYTGETPEIEYAKDYNESIMDIGNEVFLIGREYFDENDIEIGDQVNAVRIGMLEYYQARRIRWYKIQHHEETITDEEILIKSADKIETDISGKARFYTVAGTISTPSGKYDNTLFTPGTYNMTSILDFEVPLDYVEFTLANNHKAKKFRDFVATLPSNGLEFIMDTSKIDSLTSTLDIINRFYPVVIVLAVLMGALLYGITILQSKKEVAVLRILGTTRNKILRIMVMEQLILCLLGLAIGTGGLFLYNKAALVRVSSELYIFMALYIGASLLSMLVATTITNKKNALNLVQEKD